MFDYGMQEPTDEQLEALSLNFDAGPAIRRGVDLPPAPTTYANGQEKLTAYRQWLTGKIHIQEAAGFDVPLADLHPALNAEGFQHQGVITQWALRGGRRLIAAQFGIGKTVMQCEAMRQIHQRTGGKTLIVGELNVRHQFQEIDGPRLGMEIQYVTNDAEVKAATSPYLYTNYERMRDGDIDPAQFIAVSLDEGSVLADYGSKTFQKFSQLFRSTPYKFVATATPARNKYKELLHYAHFLGIADSGQALTRYFKRNSQKANELTLMESMEQEFWLWIASWALFVEKPSDLGPRFSDEGYNLPGLKVHWVRIPSDHERAWDEMDSWGQRYLFANAAAGVTQAAREKRASMGRRVEKAVEIVNQYPGEHFILWHHLEDERKLINKMLPGAVDVYGTQDLDEKERRILGFTRGEFQYLSAKPEMLGRGCNFQHHCHRAVFTGINYKFEDFLQALKRLDRFGQRHLVEAWVIYTDAEDEIVNTMQRKWRQHDELVANTTAIIKRYGLTTEAMKADMRRTMHSNRQEVKGEFFRAIHNDCVEEIANIPDNSVDLIVTSIPFGTQYEYTESFNDFGHNPDNARFWNQMDYLIPELLRILKPGRIAAIHVKDRIMYGNVTGEGVPTIDPFSDDCSYSFRKHGFLQLCRRTVVNDVVRENNQTYRLGYSEMLKDATKMGSGTPEYILPFRVPQTDKSKAYADVPVTKQRPGILYRCSKCGIELNSLAGLDTVMVQLWEEDDYEDPVERHVCPTCNEPSVFHSFQSGGYTLYHWQSDASEYWRSSGDRLLLPEDLAQMDIDQIYRWYAEYTKRNVYDHDAHRELGRELAKRGRLPKTFMLFAPGVPPAFSDSVWSVHDYSRMHTLNNRQSYRRQENHLCPLPIDLVKRCIELYSNPGEVVFDPFAGVFTVPYVAITMGRQGLGTELNEQYWQAGVHYCQEAEQKRRAPTLFDLLDYEAAQPHTNGHHVAELEVA